jgi:hypothetical protein
MGPSHYFRMPEQAVAIATTGVVLRGYVLRWFFSNAPLQHVRFSSAILLDAAPKWS